MLSCLDPEVVCNPDLRDKNQMQMKCILNHLVQAGLVQVADCDEILSEFTEFLIYSCSVSEFTSLSVSDWLDTVYFDLMSCSDRHAKLWLVIKVLLMSHGQATLERGFSINQSSFLFLKKKKEGTVEHINRKRNSRKGGNDTTTKR